MGKKKYVFIDLDLVGDDIEFTDEQKECIKLLEEGELTQLEIAAKLGVHRNTITNWVKSDKFQAAMDRCEAAKKDRGKRLIDSMADEIVEQYLELMHCSDNRTKGIIIKDLMNRIYGKPTSKLVVENKTNKDEDFDLQAALARIDDGDVPIAITALEDE